MIHFSEAACQELQRMRDRQSSSALKIRLDVRPGGCLAWYYHLSLTEDVPSDDWREHVQDLEIYIGSESRPYLNDLVVDYSEDLMGGGFRFENPNAAQTCSCSNSFSVLPTESHASTGSHASMLR